MEYIVLVMTVSMLGSDAFRLSPDLSLLSSVVSHKTGSKAAEASRASDSKLDADWHEAHLGGLGMVHEEGPPLDRVPLNFEELRSEVVSFEALFVGLPLVLFFVHHGLFPTFLRKMGVPLWLGVAVICSGVKAFVSGTRSGEDWCASYVLELTFSLESVVLFHVVRMAFDSPSEFMHSSLIATTVFQLVYKAAPHMGFVVGAQRAGPIVFTMVLICTIAWTVFGRRASGEEGQSWAHRTLWRGVANRLSLNYTDGRLFAVEEGRLVITRLFPLMACLVMVGLLFEFDLTLTHIQSSEHLSASVVALCAVPDLFFSIERHMSSLAILSDDSVFVFLLLYFSSGLLIHSMWNVEAWDLPISPRLLRGALVGGAVLIGAALLEVLRLVPGRSKFLGTEGLELFQAPQCDFATLDTREGDDGTASKQ